MTSQLLFDVGSNTNELLVYSKEVGPRLSYIVKVLFHDRARITTSKAILWAHEGARINYSTEKIETVFQIIPHGLLTEQGIREQSVTCSQWKDLPVFFQTNGELPFDLFAAAFYLVSRYEEYLPNEPDQYGRYAHTSSLAYREGFLRLPLVNRWLQHFEEALQARFGSSLKVCVSKFRFLPTYDIDIAYAYRHQPLWNNLLGFFRDLLQGKMEKVIERGNVYSGRQKDPFDVFGWLDELHAKHKLTPAYFFLTIIKRGLYDKNLLSNSRGLQRLYRRLAAVYVTGIHPSWQSGTEEELLVSEKQTLEGIVGHKIFVSRFHYLRFHLPHSYRRLIATGMTDDHSMAYGAANGFRASYASPYRWYDLEKEEITHLVIHPFCFMEATAFFEQGYTAEEAGHEMQYFHDAVQKVNGEFITLFHNHFLTEQPEWVAWRNMYEDFLEKNFKN
jgi:hypothetical protein